MAGEKCKECKTTLVLDEENLCAYCELKLGGNDGNTATTKDTLSVACGKIYPKRRMLMHNDEKLGGNVMNTATANDNISVDCGVCKVIVEEDSEGLFCDVCNTWFHNGCNETPLHFDLYALLNEAPKNVKWFCDKCIWDTEKWITQINEKGKKPTGAKKYESKLIDSSDETGNECGINDVTNKDVNGVNQDEVNSGNIEGQSDRIHAKAPGVKVELDQEDNELYMECDNIHNTTDSDEWIPNEENEVAKIKPKKKRKIYNKKANYEYTSNVTKEDLTENLSNILDISEESLANLFDGIQTIQNPKYKRSKCSLCPRDFLRIYDCIAHILKVHNGIEKPHKCSVCGKKFKAKDMRLRHMEKHDDTLKFKCDICDKKLKNHACLQTHLKRFHPLDDEFHSCMECDYKSTYRTDLTMHMIKEHSFVTKFQCTICNEYFASKSHLNSHMDTHFPGKHFCKICDTKFKNAQQLKKHIKRQHGSKTFECKECGGKRFTEECILKSHLLTHLPVEERKYPCDECDMRFNSQSYLKNHKEWHAGAKRTICDICGKVLSDKYYLKCHMMMHSDEKPLKCEICGKGFRYRGQLSLHVKYHKKIIAATCPICGFGAPTRSVLNSHIKQVHTNETPYECDACGSKYKTKGNLSKHKRGIRGSCKGFNSSNSSIQKVKQELKSSNRSFYDDEDDSKQEDSPTHFQENYSSTVLTSSVQNHENHPALLLYANSHNSNVYLTQYQGSLIAPNSRGITATIQPPSINNSNNNSNNNNNHNIVFRPSDLTQI